MTTTAIRNLSEAASAFIWTWLPGQVDPVLAGRLYHTGGRHDFGYMPDYLERENAIALGPDLPLQRGMHAILGPGLTGTLRDALPDQWGRRATLALQLGRHGPYVDTNEIGDIGYGLLAGTDGIGAISFQASGTVFEHREAPDTAFEVIAEGVSLIDQGLPVPGALAEILKYAMAVGGARPKALIKRGGERFIAKFPSWSDRRSVVRAETFGNYLSHYTNGDTVWTEIESRGDIHAMCVRRFDRDRETGARRHLVSGLTLLGLSESLARYASYEDLSQVLARLSARPKREQRKLFKRMLYNIMLGNTDDHARNHACFWDGQTLQLAPAYDLEPRPRLSHEANQAMAVCGERREARIGLAIEAAGSFGLDFDEAVGEASFLLDGMEAHFGFARVEISGMEESDLDYIGDPLLHPYCMEGAPQEIFDGLEFQLLTRKFASA